MIYKEPWSDIKEYQTSHYSAIKEELEKELHSSHILFNKQFEILAKREDKDEVLIESNGSFYIIHLTWSNKQESSHFPVTKRFENQTELHAELEEQYKDFEN